MRPTTSATLLLALLLSAACDSADAPRGPRLTWIAPFGTDTPAVLGGRVRFTVDCTDAGHPCRGVALRLNGALLAFGTGGLDTMVSLAGQPAGTARFVVTATSTRGDAATLESPEVVVRPDTGWIYVAAVGGTVLDANEHWAVYRRGGATLARNLATGAVTQLNLGLEKLTALATPTGAAVFYEDDLNSGVRILDAAGISDFPYSHGMEMRGDWFAWKGPQGVWERNLVDRREVHTLVDVARLSDDGTLTFHDPWDDFSVLYAARVDGSREEVARESGTSQTYGGITEGPQTLYIRGDGGAFQVMLRTTAGATQLFSVNAGQDLPLLSASPGIDLRDGWALWAVQDLYPKAMYLMTRSPSGQVRRADAGLSPCCWSLGYDGRVLLFANGHTYLASPPYTSAVDLGILEQPAVWHERHLFLYFGNSIFRSSW